MKILRPRTARPSARAPPLPALSDSRRDSPPPLRALTPRSGCMFNLRSKREGRPSRSVVRHPHARSIRTPARAIDPRNVEAMRITDVRAHSAPCVPRCGGSLTPTPANAAGTRTPTDRPGAIDPRGQGESSGEASTGTSSLVEEHRPSRSIAPRGAASQCPGGHAGFHCLPCARAVHNGNDRLDAAARR